MTGIDDTPASTYDEDEEELSPTTEQEEALELDQNIAITAGAGTGKTTTLTLRYLEMLESDPGIGPENIATITFTNDAANEMQERIREEVAERLSEAPESDEYDYSRWRSIKDELENGYIHTIHGFCSRLLREYVVEAPVQPEFDTLDEADSKVLMQEVVRETIDARWGANEDIRRLARLWNRDSLEQVLVGLLESRPRSTEWATRWEGSTVDEYLDHIWSTFYPIDRGTAEELLKEESVQEALHTICGLHDEELEIDPDDKGMQFMQDVTRVVRDTGVHTNDAEGYHWQRALDSLCDHLTSNSGERYTGRQRFRYRGSKSNWSAHEEEQEQLDAAVSALLDGLNPEERDFIGGLDTEWNSSHYVLSLARLYSTVLDEYRQTKSEQNALDYHDLIQTCIDFLNADDRLCEQVQSQFEYVMVDEMQDTDLLQWELIKLLTAGDTDDFDAQNVFLVGDEKQSIYRFRGADVTTFGSAREDLAAANPDDVETTKQLRGNFRTIQETREFLNALFDEVFEPMDDEYRDYEAKPQALTDERRQGRDVTGSVEYLLVPDEDVPELHDTDYLNQTPRFAGHGEREAHALASRLTSFLDDPPEIYDDDEECLRPAKPEDITILLRARTRLKEHERALDECGIPYTVVSGTGFWDAPEITGLVNLFTFFENPEDDIALYGVLRSPLFGFPDEDLARLHSEDQPLWAALQTAEDDLGDAARLLDEWRQIAAVTDDVTADTTVPWGTLLSRIIDDTGFIASVGADERPRQAAVNINKFREQVRAWEEGGVKTVSELLTRIDRRKEIESHADEATIPEDADGVQIRTIHSAKGLEFPIVAIPEVGTEFNFQGDVDDYGKVYLDELDVGDGESEPVLGLKAPSADDPYEHQNTLARTRLQEEVRMQERAELKRLLYVAATRTRDHLLFSGVHSIDADEEDGLGLGDPNDAADARYWRDWLQPILLEDEDGDAGHILSQLSVGAEHTTTISGSEYTVRVPTAPVHDWDASAATERDYPQIDIPAPEVSTPPTSITATNFAKALSPDDAAVYTDELEEDAASLETDGLQANHLGTIVHKLCELRPDRDRWRSIAARLGSALDDTVTDGDLDRIEEYTERCLQFRDDVVDDESPTTIHEELSVVTRLEAGRIVGDIDLLLVTPDSYHVIDYKTNDTSQRSVDDLAEKYWPQLEVYVAALHQNDDSRIVHTTLYFADADEHRTTTHDMLSLDILGEDLNTQLEGLTQSDGAAVREESSNF
ncbi:UvrD-helicase domain-containing protein [Halalkaliarchaeum sp. AArc-GB]|uniref:UvrD-helicase domain-containing protein n=1 Tax=Halalkaliarchaeum sp. AArc-GB TaxID=3074078 RepID=UPI00285D9160|nr:UvrD-helicase domain-containing protein [Halalkaliarchaeum sp. AArc-GB]MDR5673623.1 UvrD-helicase domain-containing protein [Halalkaliarchaeum sp. AArc-GB]